MNLEQQEPIAIYLYHFLSIIWRRSLYDGKIIGVKLAHWVAWKHAF